MNISKQSILCMLVVVLAAVMVPLRNRTAALPCQYIWRYAISYGPSQEHVIKPDDGFPGFSPLCLEIMRLYGNSL